MFGLKEHMYLEGTNTNEMGKFLKSFIPLLIIKQKGNVTFRCGDEEINGGKYYKVLCSDKMANTIERYFGFNKTLENAGTYDGEPVDLKLKGP